MVKRKSSSAQTRADGPSSLSELLRLPEQFGKILAHPDCSANWDRLSENGFIVTSGYSGTGAFELASDMVLCSASDAAGEKDGSDLCFLLCFRFSRILPKSIADASAQNETGTHIRRHVRSGASTDFGRATESGSQIFGFVV